MAELKAVLVSIPDGARYGRPQRLQQQRSAARRALALCAQRLDLAHIEWRQDANRVPLPSGPHHWSISHKPLMAAAVIAPHPVGIDIEHVIPRRNTDLWSRVADAREWGLLAAASWESFYRIWTAKEAVLKANGRGIGHLEHCRLIGRPDRDHLVLTFNASTWHVRQASFDAHIAGVTVHSPHQPVDWYQA